MNADFNHQDQMNAINKLKDPDNPNYSPLLDHIQDTANKEFNRRKDIAPSKPHPTVLLTLQGVQAHIDQDIAPVIQWLNSLPNTYTSFSCQGDIQHPHHKQISHRPYVLWFCNKQPSLEYILSMFDLFRKHHATNNGTVTHHFYTVETQVEMFQDKIRYNSKWYDNLSLQDFTQWLSHKNNLPLAPPRA